MKINHPIKGLIDYKPYPFQEELIDAILEGKNVIVKSARQMGISTTIFYCIRELCLKTPGYKALFVTSNGYRSDGLNKFPDDEFVKKKTKYKIEFENGSIIEFVPGSKLNTDKKDYEVFFDGYEYISEPIKESVKTVTDVDKIRFLSFTGNSGFDMNGFKTIKWNYTLHPSWGNWEHWKNEQVRIFGEETFKKEFEVN